MGRDSGAQWGAQELGGQALAVVKREAGVGRPQPSGWAGQSKTGQDERSGRGGVERDRIAVFSGELTSSGDRHSSWSGARLEAGARSPHGGGE